MKLCILNKDFNRLVYYFKGLLGFLVVVLIYLFHRILVVVHSSACSLVSVVRQKWVGSSCG